MNKSEVLFLAHNMHRIENLRESKLAYAIIKNMKKLAKEKEIIIEQLNKMRGKIPIEKFPETEKGKAILEEESSINLYLLKEIPAIEMTAAELQIVDYMMETEAEDNGKPEGPPIPPSK